MADSNKTHRQSVEAVGPSSQMPEATAKAINDLDQLVSSLGQSLPTAMPWQRQLKARLARLMEEIQLVRMTIALNRDQFEKVATSSQVHAALVSMSASLSKSRADTTTKAAIQLATGLAKQVLEQLNR